MIMIRRNLVEETETVALPVITDPNMSGEWDGNNSTIKNK